MPARNETFPWTSYYGHYNYFEEIMSSHGKIKSIASEGSGIYNLVRSSGDGIRVFICECYAFGVAEYMETVEKVGRVNAVIINSAWCGYSTDAKRHCRDSKVGLFSIGEFMGALHRDDYWRFLTDAEKEHFKAHGWQ